MSKDLKNLLEEKLQQNNQRYVTANPSVKFLDNHRILLIKSYD
ncbi:MAG: hypothetical protein QX189_07980 [Methylococcales bacterium]